MNRRQLLATVGGLGTGTLAGCSTISGPRTLDDPTVEREDSEVHLVFGERDDPIAVSTFRYRPAPGSDTDMVHVNYYMEHRRDTHVDALELAILAPPTGGDPPAALYLAVPDRSGPDLRVRTDADTGARIVEIPELGTLGRGTFGLECYLDPSDVAETLTARVEVESTVSGTRILDSDYRLRGSAELEIPMD